MDRGHTPAGIPAHNASLEIKLSLKLSQNAMILIHENALESVVCKMMAMLSPL